MCRGSRYAGREREARYLVTQGLFENPLESINWRRHRNGCPHYRVRWYPENDFAAGEPMYQVYCRKNTPPETFDEQEKCLNSRTECWRIAEARRKGDGAIPLTSVKRRAHA
jgi:hypothetical protein